MVKIVLTASITENNFNMPYSHSTFIYQCIWEVRFNSLCILMLPFFQITSAKLIHFY